MKARIGHPVTMLAAARQKRGFGAPLAACGGGHIALRYPATRKPWAHIPVRPLGASRLARVPWQRIHATPSIVPSDEQLVRSAPC